MDSASGKGDAVMSAAAFLGDPDLKQHVLDRVRRHVADKEVTPGAGFWDGQRGCLGGVAVHDADATLFEREIGIPAGVLFIAERLWEVSYWFAPMHVPGFESPISDDGRRLWQFPADWLDAIAPGACVGKVPGLFLVSTLRRAARVSDATQECSEASALLHEVTALHANCLAGESIDRATWKALRAGAARAASAATNDIDRTLAEIAGIAAWQCTPNGSLTADVLEADTKLSGATARRALAWTLSEEAQRVQLEQERVHLLTAEGEGRAEPTAARAALRAYDERVKAEQPEFLVRCDALRTEEARHKLARVFAAEAEFLLLLTAATLSRD